LKPTPKKRTNTPASKGEEVVWVFHINISAYHQAV
jgi:hypothetical protein